MIKPFQPLAVVVALTFGLMALNSCKEDNPVNPQYQDSVDLQTQNTYDDAAANKFLENNYLDNRGNIKTFSSTDASDDSYKKLSEMNPVKLPSGVIYVVREGAQPAVGSTIHPTDVIHIMQKSFTYLATNENNSIDFRSPFVFKNTIDGSGTPEVDPAYYYVKNSTLSTSGKDRSFYEIEGFKEALQHFKAFDISNENNYNLQGVIIVPSRAAFARDDHFPYGSYAFRNRSFVFNFQIYNSTARTANQD